MDRQEHMVDAIRYAFEAKVESEKRAEEAKRDLIQTLKHVGMFLLGVLVTSIFWIICTVNTFL